MQARQEGLGGSFALQQADMDIARVRRELAGLPQRRVIVEAR